MKPNQSKRSGFIEYIAKREGVLKDIQSFASKPQTSKQKHLIKRLLKEYPQIKNSETYQTYLQNKTIGSASELITTLEENHFTDLNNIEEYVSYIAQRPRVAKEGSHGLFSDTQEPIILEQVKTKIQNHPGNIWTAIVSLTREDARRLGYESLDPWKTLVRSNRNELAKHLKIDASNFEWYGAFHNESHHPHIHLVMFAKDGKQGYINEKSLDGLRSTFARDIFHNEHLHIYKQQTEYRNLLKTTSKDFIHERIHRINQTFKANDIIDQKLLELSNHLQTLGGKHTYGYLPKPLKQLVDDITDELSNDPSIQNLFDLWYQQRQEILSTYTDKKEEIRHLSDLNEFKPIKNSIIKLADEIRITSNQTNAESIIEETLSESVIESSYNSESKPVSDFKFDNILDTINLENKAQQLDNSSPATSTEKDTNSSKTTSLLPASMRLMLHVSRLFENSMQTRIHNYQVDHKLLLKIKKQKIALGMNEDDTVQRRS